MLIEIYTDGSSDGKSESKIGWAFVICVDGIQVAEGSGSLDSGTNNTAEVIAAIRGLDYINTNDVTGCDPSSLNDSDEEHSETDGTRIVLISDSQLTLKWATGEYQCKKWHLIPLVIELRKLLKKTNATTRWVKGHNGQEQNERCDQLAKAARASITDSASN